jgi:SAM-dependent methyltransferase
MNLEPHILKKMRCPVCHAKLDYNQETLNCSTKGCAVFPIVGRVPVILNESRSLFKADQFGQQIETQKTFKTRLQAQIERILPEIDINIGTAQNFNRFGQKLMKKCSAPTVLVIGGRVTGEGMQTLLDQKKVHLVETDIAMGPRADMICDAHDIPFEDGAFDGVVIQAVLEHVLDPVRCVAEIYRVLNETGLVYAETPFMQPVHMGRYDFTRFTRLGHRRLFRAFDELSSGPVAGTGLALALACQYFLMSFCKTGAMRFLTMSLSRLLFFWLKYFDYYLVAQKSTSDAAAGFYFMGQKSEKLLADKTLIGQYQGGFR